MVYRGHHIFMNSYKVMQSLFLISVFIANIAVIAVRRHGQLYTEYSWKGRFSAGYEARSIVGNFYIYIVVKLTFLGLRVLAVVLFSISMYKFYIVKGKAKQK